MGGQARIPSLLNGTAFSVPFLSPTLYRPRLIIDKPPPSCHIPALFHVRTPHRYPPRRKARSA